MPTRFSRALATTAAAALVTASTAAAAAPAPVSARNPAASLSLSHARVGTPTAGKSRFAGLPGSTLLNIANLAALTVVVLTVVSDNDASN